MDRPSVSLIIPAYNDESAVGGVVEKAVAHLEATSTRYEIIVINDGSTDGTAGVLAASAARHLQVRVLTHERNHGYGRTLGELYRLAKMDVLISLHGDDQLPIGNLKVMLPGLARYDVVVGRRRPRRDPWHRRLMSWLYNRSLRLLFGLQVSDVNSSKLIRREVLTAMTLVSESPFVDAELCLRAARGGFRVGEVDVEHHPRQFGRHSWTWWPTLQGTFQDVLNFRRAVP